MKESSRWFGMTTGSLNVVVYWLEKKGLPVRRPHETCFR
jgi:hypothetical protein